MTLFRQGKAVLGHYRGGPGTMIDAIWSGDGGWYAATITGIGPGDALTVRFDDGIVERTEVAKCRSE